MEACVLYPVWNVIALVFLNAASQLNTSVMTTLIISVVFLCSPGATRKAPVKRKAANAR